MPADRDAVDVSRLLADLGMEATVLPVGAEDPFADVDDLDQPRRVDSAHDFVWCLGPRSPTAVNLALHLDLPMLCSPQVDEAMVEAAEMALTGTSEIHRAVLDVRVHGARRLVPGAVDLGPGPFHLELTKIDGSSTMTVDSPVRVTSELPATGRLSVAIDAGPRHMADRVTITANAPARMAVGGGREQLVEHVQLAVLDRPLRELVLGAGPRHRTVVDAGAL